MVINSQAQKISFRKFLETAFDQGDYATDDVIAFVLPLFKEVLDFHEEGKVAPFEKERALFVSGQQLDIDESLAHPAVADPEKISELLSAMSAGQFEVVDKLRRVTDAGEGSAKVTSETVNFSPNEGISLPAFVPGYRCFEDHLGHHDALTDIFCLGLVLGSISLGLDLYDPGDLETFAAYRTSPVQFNPRLHPAISALITEMTELDRRKRTRDLYEVIQRLEHYRDFDPEKQTDLSRIAGWVNKDLSTRSQLILDKLRSRLFNTSRRNRLLYYKPNMCFLNLTVSSVPNALHYQSIRPEHLFTWNPEIAGRISGMKEIVLNKYLRFEDHRYLPSVLDKIRVEAQRDVQEFGFSQLKLVIAFLNWHNLKEDREERIQSPLLLIPAELKKNKRLKEDHYVMKVLDNNAEVNPVLANQLRELYGIKLPAFVDLEEMDLVQFYQLLKEQIEASGQGIQLQYIDKPRIKLIHSIARTTVSNFNKRLKRKPQECSYRDLNYSYQPENYQPLGLEIFRSRIEPRTALLEFLVNDEVKLSRHHLTGTSEKERELFELAESESNPFSWDFDVCNIVLGNFNYKKMSLVRDYNSVIDEKIENKVFEKLFSPEPKRIETAEEDKYSPEDLFHVISADPTQTRAILHNRKGESYIIQGPPGTGKSQTITNLIADFVAAGKKVLFVCEKRAALDVVFHRLRQQGLDELCCYIHDSQGDKREFIRNLKSMYEDFTMQRMALDEISKKRAAVLEAMREQLGFLEAFHSANAAVTGEAGVETWKLIGRIIELRDHLVSFGPKEEELLPHYAEWRKFGDAICELCASLEECGAEPDFSGHIFSRLNEELFGNENPVAVIESTIRSSRRLIHELEAVIAECSIPPEFTSRLHSLKDLVGDAVLLLPLAGNENIRLVMPENPEAREFDRGFSKYKSLLQKAEALMKKNANWKNKFSGPDTLQALAIAEKYERSFFRFFNGSWRKLKKQLESSYDFSAHQVRPVFSALLSRLKEEYESADALEQHRKKMEADFRLKDLEAAHSRIERFREKKEDRETAFLLGHPDANVLVKRLSGLNASVHELDLLLKKLHCQPNALSFEELKDELESILLNLPALQDLLPALQKFSGFPERLKSTLRNISLHPLPAEASMAHKSLKQVYRNNRSLASCEIHHIERSAAEIRRSCQKLLQLNAGLIRATIRNEFLKNLELSNTAVSQLNAAQRQVKKAYSEGRKILENEFGKSMRYKSIRELASKESGLVLKDLKPVWLMSPLSVSDSLPLDASFFDVVIFDEASQITLEEGVPSLYRAPQAIIVGDDKQMPPTNFFTARADDPDDLEVLNEETDDELLSTDADSLLVQGARKLNSVMLGWHYRSRHETLISFSNHAFYEAGLFTIPDKTIHHAEKPPIEIHVPADAAKFSGALFDRSMSYHFIRESVYEKRINQAEADYIASLVRELLQKKIRDSIGIVAFSQEQQMAIENSLSALAASDKQFGQLLEEAYDRMEEDQFVGLFVKNLENVQGDERDIIIMSVCYGPDARKRMIMNFGPINKRGGEKRLNVIFSRAKKHMAVVSSIHYHQVTNEYNEGANYFRRFLQYAEAVSTGNMQSARGVLDGLVVNKKDRSDHSERTVAAKQLKAALEKAGFEVEESVGQSGFKCSLAIKERAGDEHYCMGILVDDEQHYRGTDLLELYFQRPEILKRFGWRLMQVFAKDWLHDPGRVMESILKRMKEDPSADEQEEREGESFFVPAPPTAETGGQKISSVVSAAVASPYDHLKFRRLTAKSGQSNKFWEAALDGNKLIVRFGRTGTRGQLQVKTFIDNAAALKEMERLVREKLNKGYADESMINS